MRSRHEKTFDIFIALTFLICTRAVFAYDQCIALTNVGDTPVEFSGLIDPGYTYTVNPGSSATLSGDHMVGSCIRDKDKNDCIVSVLVLDGTYQHHAMIDHLPQGARIFFNHVYDYQVDRNAHVKCGS